MTRFFRCAGVLLLLTGPLHAGVPSEPPDRTATIAPVGLPMAGKWQRVDVAYEKEVFVVDREGKVKLGESGLDATGRCRALSADVIQLDVRNVLGSGRRFTCRWRIQGDILTLEILTSKSQAGAGAEYHVLDVDRSAQGETWRFQRAR